MIDISSPPEFFSMRKALLAVVTGGLFFFGTCVSAQSNPCDLNSDGSVTGTLGTTPKSDVQLAVDMSLGSTSCTANILGLGTCNIVVVQRVINGVGKGSASCVAGVNGHYVTLSWVASTTPNVTYKVYRGTQTGGPYSPLTTTAAQQVPGTSFNDTNVQPGLSYYYVVSAVDVSGNESAKSGEAAAGPIPAT